MSASCDFVDIAVREFLEGAKDLEKFAAAMKRRFGRDIDPAILEKAFAKAAGRYERNLKPLGDIKLELAQELAKGRRSGAIETLTAVRRAGLVSGPATHVTNLSSNALSAGFDALARLPASVVDMAIGRYTGVRTITPLSLDVERRGIVKGIVDGFKDAKNTLRYGMTDADLAKYDVPKELNVNMGPSIPGRATSAILNFWTNGIQRLMSAGDKIPRSVAYNRSLAEQAHLIAKKEGLKGAERSARINELVQGPPQAMQIQAISDAEQAVFANSNMIADQVTNARRGLNAKGVPGKSLMFTFDTFVPFVRTPTNIAGRILESSPVGLIYESARGGGAVAKNGFSIKKLIAEGGLDEATQKHFSTALGRGTAGTALIYLGYRLAEQGKMTPTYSTDRGVADREEAVGHSPASLVLNGKSYNLSESPPGILMAIGAAIHRDSVDAKKPVNLLMAGTRAAGRQVLDAPMLQGVADFEEAARRPDTGLPKIANNLAGSVVPSLLAASARASDDVERSAKGPVDAMKARVPGLRQQVPPKRDALGRTIPSTSWWNRMDGPQERTDAVSRELSRLKVSLQKPNRIKNEKDPLADKTEEAYQERLEATGKAIFEALNRTVSAPWYKNLSDAQKSAQIQRQIAAAKRKVSDQLRAAANRRAFYEKNAKSTKGR